MKDDETKRVHINGALRDTELDEMHVCAAAAEPGEWRVAQTGPRIVRHGGDPVTSLDSFVFMAKARGYVPRLLRGVHVLEDALRTAWADAASWKRATLAEREARKEDALRRSEKKTGPENEIGILARLCELGSMRAERVEQLLRVWAGGASINVGGCLDSELEHAEKHRREREEITQAVEAEFNDARERLRDWLQRLDDGEVPEAMREQWTSKSTRRACARGT